MDDLLDALQTGSDVVRGHAADAVERVSRERPELIMPALPKLLTQARQDPVAMVRWHLAMVFANLARSGEDPEPLAEALLGLLEDPSPFVKSWAVSGLCLIARDSPLRNERFLASISPLRNDRSIAVRHRAARAIRILMDEREPIPPSWIKRK
jgi:HEAT repeat protein